MTRRLMAAAFTLAARGWFVFPLQPRDKRPVRGFTRWEERATRDPQTIYNWWSEAPYNVGVATGPSKLLVVDCDAAHDDTPPAEWVGATSGLDVLIKRAHDAGVIVPKTLAVQTPSGGLHLYFQAPDGVSLGNTAGKLGWHIDTRGIGGYVVGAESVLPAGSYTIIADNTVASLPRWMTEALTPQHYQQEERVEHVGLSRGYIRAILREESERIITARPGTRNNTLNIAAFRLGQLVGSGLLTEQQALSLLGDGARVHVGIDGFTEAEMHRTIKSGLSAGQRQHGRR